MTARNPVLSTQHSVPSPRQVVWAVTAGYFLIMLAVSPVSVVLPTMAADLDVDLARASWVMAAYLLPLTGLLLPAGRMGDLLGHRRVFAAGLALVTVASVLAGLAPTLAALVAARALQGIGAALASGNSLAIIAEAVPDHERGRAIGLATMASSLGAMVGTALAPLVLAYLHWRWAFLIGAPGGVAALAMALRLPLPRPSVTRVPLDVSGALLLVGALGALALSLQHLHDGPETFEAGAPYHVTLHAITLALLAAFVWVERRVPAPLVLLDQLRHRLFSAAIVANGVLHMTMMMAIFSIPFLIEQGMGMTPGRTGVLLTVMQGVTTGMTLAGGWLYDRTRSPLLRPLGLGSVAAGLLVLSVIADSISYSQLFALLVVMGAGSGLFMTANNAAIMGALPGSYRGFASGMLETTRQLGHALGVAVATAGMAVAGVSVGAALGVAGAAQATLVEGFQQACLLMGLIAVAGAACAAVRAKAARPSPVVAELQVAEAGAAAAPTIAVL